MPEYPEHASSNPDLSMMREHTQNLALHGQWSPRFKPMRKELIERLGEIRLKERN